MLVLVDYIGIIQYIMLKYNKSCSSYLKVLMQKLLLLCCKEECMCQDWHIHLSYRNCHSSKWGALLTLSFTFTEICKFHAVLCDFYIDDNNKLVESKLYWITPPHTKDPSCFVCSLFCVEIYWENKESYFMGCCIAGSRGPRGLWDNKF